MKVKDIIRVQNAIIDAVDFIASNSDGDESGIREELLNEFDLCDKLLQKEKERIYLKNAKQKLKNRTHNFNRFFLRAIEKNRLRKKGHLNDKPTA